VGVSIRLSEDEAWAEVDAARTGVLGTLRADGRPVTLPVWFVVLDREIYFQTPTRAKKIGRIRRDPRASFLVESGDRWTELVGVHLEGRAEVVDDDELADRARGALDDKYEGLGVPRGAPRETKARYAHSTVIRFVPEGKILTWDNSRLGL
jgi:PPOX class probable F420-dependent enzyme